MASNNRYTERGSRQRGTPLRVAVNRLINCRRMHNPATCRTLEDPDRRRNVPRERNVDVKDSLNLGNNAIVSDASQIAG